MRARNRARQMAAIVAAWTALVIPSTAQADTVAAAFKSNGYQSGGYNQNIGWGFAPTQNITVTSLGWFDSNSTIFGAAADWQPGFSTPHTIGIFTSAGQLLVSGTIGAGLSGDIAGSAGTNMIGVTAGDFRFIGVSPTALTAGQTYVIAGNNPLPSTDPFAVVNAQPNNWSLFQTDPAIAFVHGWQSAMGTGGSLLFPTNDPAPGVTGVYLGPNFQFTTTPITTSGDPPAVHNPEPASLAAWLTILGVGQVLWIVRRRSAQRSAV